MIFLIFFIWVLITYRNNGEFMFRSLSQIWLSFLMLFSCFSISFNKFCSFSNPSLLQWLIWMMIVLVLFYYTSTFGEYSNQNKLLECLPIKTTIIYTAVLNIARLGSIEGFTSETVEKLGGRWKRFWFFEIQNFAEKIFLKFKTFAYD